MAARVTLNTLNEELARRGQPRGQFPLMPSIVPYAATSLVDGYMSESNCPICYALLEVREVAPCWDCGADPAELGHLAEGRHKYAEFLIFDTGIILCNFVRWISARTLQTTSDEVIGFAMEGV
jgi:hypothetical protein